MTIKSNRRTARKVAARGSRKSKRSSNRSSARLAPLLGGPNASTVAAVNYTQVEAFDIGTTPTMLRTDNRVIVPMQLDLYAVPPRDTTLGASSETMARVHYVLSMNQMFGATVTTIDIFDTQTVLPYNGRIKRVASVNYAKLLAKGLNFQANTSGIILGQLEVLADSGSGIWGTQQISMYARVTFSSTIAGSRVLTAEGHTPPTLIDFNVSTSTLTKNATLMQRMTAKRVQMAVNTSNTKEDADEEGITNL